jgi:hypothetical protein
MRPQPGSRATHRGRVIAKLGESFDGAERREIARTFDSQIAERHRKVTEGLIEIVIHLTQ